MHFQFHRPSYTIVPTDYISIVYLPALQKSFGSAPIWGWGQYRERTGAPARAALVGCW